MSNLSCRAETMLLSLVYQLASIQELIDAAAMFIGTPIRFSPDNDIDRAIVSPGYPMEDIEYVKSILATDEYAFHTFVRVVAKTEDQKEPIILKRDDGTYKRIFCNVCIGLRYYGNLSVPHVERDLETVDLELVHTVARIIGLGCAVHGVRGYDRTDDSLLEALLTGVVKDKAQLSLRTQNWWKYQHGSWRLIYVALPEGASPTLVLSALRRIAPGPPAAVTECAVCLLLDVQCCDVDDCMGRKLQEIADCFQTTVLVGPRFGDILSCAARYAGMVNWPQVKKCCAGELVWCDRHRDYLLFSLSSLGSDELGECCNPVVARIESYDREHGSDYLATLSALVVCCNNAHKAAEMLCVHVNTVVYRSRRLREVFGVDLSEPGALFDLSLTLRIREYMA